MNSLFPSVLLSLSICTPSQHRSVPVVGPFEDRFRNTPYTDAEGNAVAGFCISSVHLDGHWLVGLLEWTELRGSHDMRPAPWHDAGPSSILFSVNLANKRTFQLLPPFDPETQRQFELIRLKEARCLFVIREWNRHPEGRGSLKTEKLWQWKLDDQNVSAIGQWTESKRLSMILGMDRVHVNVMQTVQSGSQRVTLHDPQTGGKAEIQINSDALVSQHGGIFPSFQTNASSTVIAGSKSTSIIVFEEDMAKRPVVSCVDPNAVGGRSWSVTADDLERQFGSSPVSVVPVGGVSLSENRLLVQLETENPEQCVLASLNRSNGEIAKIMPLPYTPTSIVASQDGRRIAIVGGDELDSDFRVIDLHSRDTVAFTNRMNFGDIYPFAFNGNGTVFAHDGVAIWKLDTETWTGEKVFALHP